MVHGASGEKLAQSMDIHVKADELNLSDDLFFYLAIGKKKRKKKKKRERGSGHLKKATHRCIRAKNDLRATRENPTRTVPRTGLSTTALDTRPPVDTRQRPIDFAMV